MLHNCNLKTKAINERQPKASVVVAGAKKNVSIMITQKQNNKNTNTIKSNIAVVEPKLNS